MIPLDEQMRPTWLFGQTVHEGCDRAGYYEQGDFAAHYGDIQCIVKLGCWGPVVQCNVAKRGWMAGIGGCPNVGGICIGCTMPGFPTNLCRSWMSRRELSCQRRPLASMDAPFRALRNFTRATLNKEPAWRAILRRRKQLRREHQSDSSGVARRIAQAAKPCVAPEQAQAILEQMAALTQVAGSVPLPLFRLSTDARNSGRTLSMTPANPGTPTSDIARWSKKYLPSRSWRVWTIRFTSFTSARKSKRCSDFPNANGWKIRSSGIPSFIPKTASGGARNSPARAPTGVQFRSEYRLIARDGHTVWVHGECQVVKDDQGRPLFLQGIAYDITENKRAEEVLRKAHDELDARVRERTAELAQVNDALRRGCRAKVH